MDIESGEESDSLLLPPHLVKRLTKKGGQKENEQPLNRDNDMDDSLQFIPDTPR